ncbi:MAG: hypothetical protein ACLFWB_08410 [Armatimonadota bacterium]
MRIARLSIENFLGIAECDLKPGKVTVISGANQQGKTSILKALQTAFSGSGDLSDRIHDNEEKAVLLVELDDGVTVERRITVAGNYPSVEEDGLERKGPQTWLNELIGEGTLAFNPVEFFEAKPDRQRELLLNAIPVHVTEEQLCNWFGLDEFPGIDTDRHGLEVLAEVEDFAYEERRDANADVKALKSRVDTLAEDIPDDFDAETWRGVDVSELQAEIEAAGTVRERKQNLKEKIRNGKRNILTLTEKREALIEQIREIDDAIDVQEEANGDLQAELNELEVPDVSEAKDRLAEYSDAQAVLADIDALEETQEKLSEAETIAENWDRIVQTVREKPDELLEEADIPIEGLEIRSDTILLNGIEIENLSDSEQLLFALDVVRAMNSDFPIICIDGAESLDGKHFDLLIEQAQNDDFQYFITRVDESDLTIETDPDSELREAADD